MNNLKTATGFFCTYFELLPNYKTQVECFEYLNNELAFINGFKMFKDYKHFKDFMYCYKG